MSVIDVLEFAVKMHILAAAIAWLAWQEVWTCADASKARRMEYGRTTRVARRRYWGDGQ